MRPSFVVSLLILSLLLTKAQGIRLGKGSLEAQQQKQHDEESTLLKRSNTNAEEATLCKDEQCTGSQKKRASRVSNQLPNIHEDYYGPRRHRPRHH
ncbi:hypothetical protein SESBI_44285 [Sesbania bispinosa]|nr:hypothetical protein SESBI_44285 [Sesbania bispinosa]